MHPDYLSIGIWKLYGILFIWFWSYLGQDLLPCVSGDPEEMFRSFWNLKDSIVCCAWKVLQHSSLFLSLTFERCREVPFLLSTNEPRPNLTVGDCSRYRSSYLPTKQLLTCWKQIQLLCGDYPSIKCLMMGLARPTIPNLLLSFSKRYLEKIISKIFTNINQFIKMGFMKV